MIEETIEYASSIDGLAPLKADVCFEPGGGPKPLAAVLHGFHCMRWLVAEDCRALARRGMFCVAPDMRGHADSAGEHDCGGLQICDIVDALAQAARRWPDEIDKRRINALGYSGGGGNVQSLFTKFPDLLNAGASFFGISDYALWHRTKGRVDCNETMEKALGGGPDVVPERYAARASLPAIENNPHTRLHLFWDAEETACPPILNERLLEAAERLGHTNVTAHISKPGDPHRWFHGYRFETPDLNAGDDFFVPDFLTDFGRRAWPESGELVVCGYVVTRRFSVWIGDGLAGTARVRYQLGKGKPEIEVIEASSDAPVRVIDGPTLLAWCADE